MNTWHELMIVQAEFYAKDSVSSLPDDISPFDSFWWFPTEDIAIEDAIISEGFMTYRFHHNAIRLTLKPVPCSSYPGSDSYLGDFFDDMEWHLYYDQLAGIVMAKRLNDSTRRGFTFMTRWSITEDVRRDQEGLADSDVTVELDGELDLESLKVDFKHITLQILQVVSEHTTILQDGIANTLLVDASGNPFGQAMWWLHDGKRDQRLINRVRGECTLTARGRAYLNGDILP